MILKICCANGSYNIFINICNDFFTVYVLFLQVWTSLHFTQAFHSRHCLFFSPQRQSTMYFGKVNQNMYHRLPKKKMCTDMGVFWNLNVSLELYQAVSTAADAHHTYRLLSHSKQPSRHKIEIDAVPCIASFCDWRSLPPQRWNKNLGESQC